MQASFASYIGGSAARQPSTERRFYFEDLDLEVDFEAFAVDLLEADLRLVEAALAVPSPPVLLAVEVRLPELGLDFRSAVSRFTSLLKLLVSPPEVFS